MATSNLMRRNRRIVTHLHNEEIEDHFGQSAGAMRTYAELQRFLDTSPMNELIEARSAEIRAKIDGDEAITVQATIYSPCDCEEGQPLWC